MQELPGIVSPLPAVKQNGFGWTGAHVFAAGSTSAAFVMAIYIALTSLTPSRGSKQQAQTSSLSTPTSATAPPTYENTSANTTETSDLSTVVNTSDAADAEISAQVEHPIKGSTLTLSDSATSRYDVDVRPEQLAKMRPSASCSSDGDDKGMTCFLEGEQNQAAFCAFSGCQEQAFSFDPDGRLKSLLAEVQKADWTKLGSAVAQHSGIAPQQSVVSVGPVQQMFTCFAMKNGALIFGEADGVDFYGSPMKHPFSISFEFSNDCSSVPGRRVSR